MARSGHKKSRTTATDLRPTPNRTSSESQQQTISELFSSQQKPAAIYHSPYTPNKKRKRPNSTAAEATQATPTKPASTDNMYNFASKNGANGIVDLTNSPNGSPKRPRRISVSAKVENAPSPHGPKKLIVRNFRTNAKSDSSQYIEKTTKQLQDGMLAVFADKRPEQSNEELYKGCEHLCKLGQAPELTRMLKDRCQDYISNTIKEPLMEVADGKNVAVLGVVIQAWTKWMKQMNAIRGIFFFLDRSHLLQSQQPTVLDYAIFLFRKHIFADPALRDKIVEGACDLLSAERHDSNASDSTLFADAVKMFHELQSFIATWSNREVVEKELPDYVSASEKLMDAEMRRCKDFDLDRSTRNRLLTLLEDHIIERKQAELTNQDGVADELDKDTPAATASMKALFDLLQKRRMGENLRGPFSKWIDDAGTAIVFDEKEEDQMVVRLLEFKQKIDHIWRFAFGKHESLGHALRGSFEAFMNKVKKSNSTWNTDNSKTGEMIAKYVDFLLKKGAKGIPSNLKINDGKKPARFIKRFDAEAEAEPEENTAGVVADEDTEVDNQLDQVLDLFRFVHGKAVFEAFYKKDLARRLLMGRSASNDAEKNMLTRLKTECGAGFTHNLEQMFKDIELAEEEAKAYKNRYTDTSSITNKAAKAGHVDLTVNILSSAAWPTYPDVPIAVPQEVTAAIADFERFYYSKHSGRKLSWKHALAHCQMRADFPKGKKDLVVSAFQAIVLLLFNGLPEAQHIHYQDIKSATNLNDQDCQRTLQSLACAKLRPLTKHPKGKDVAPTDTFTLNTAFTADRYRLKINQIQLKETKEENKETHVRVAADRQFETQAAIVRIMKSKKRLQHAQLVAEVIGATRSRGVLQPGEIKREVDKLVEKEYLERVDGAYEYLA